MLFLVGALVALAGSPENLQEALQAQRTLVAENPADANLLNDLGNLLALAGDFEDAEDAYRRALDIDPGDVSARYNLALVLREQGNTKEAQKTLGSILELNPRHAWTHYQLGTLYAEKKNRRKAVHHYARAFALDRSLTSPNVNPHIVQNRLATEALLKMYVEESPSTQAPRIYEEPDSVADLLLPRESAEPGTEPAPEAAPEAPIEPIPRRRTSYTDPEASEPDSELPARQGSDGPQVEGSETWPDASPPAPRRIDASTIGTQRSPTRESQTESSGIGSIQDPTEGVSGPPSSGQPAPKGSSSPSSGGRSDSSSSYLPGVESTGRLEIELLPAVEDVAATSPT